MTEQEKLAHCRKIYMALRVVDDIYPDFGTPALASLEKLMEEWYLRANRFRPPFEDPIIEWGEEYEKKILPHFE